MPPSGVNIRRLTALVIALLVVPGSVHGCRAPNEPAPPPSGGTQLSLDFTQFEQTVEPVLSGQGCDAGGDCHGGGIRGSLQLSPAGAKDARFDFNQVVLQVWPSAPDSSPILTEPLAISAGGTAHGYKPFADTTDTNYRAIRAWIDSGVRK
jgi:hypothetical protein